MLERVLEVGLATSCQAGRAGRPGSRHYSVGCLGEEGPCKSPSSASTSQNSQTRQINPLWEEGAAFNGVGWGTDAAVSTPLTRLAPTLSAKSVLPLGHVRERLRVLLRQALPSRAETDALTHPPADRQDLLSPGGSSLAEAKDVQVVKEDGWLWGHLLSLAPHAGNELGLVGEGCAPDAERAGELWNKEGPFHETLRGAGVESPVGPEAPCDCWEVSGKSSPNSGRPQLSPSV